MESKGPLFERLPEEVHLIISEHVERGHGTLKALACVNKRFRAIYHRRLFTRMYIHGNMDRRILTTLLINFCLEHGSDSVKKLQKLVTHATLDGDRGRLASAYKDYATGKPVKVYGFGSQRPPSLLFLIAESIRLMPNLETLTLDTRGLEWEEEDPFFTMLARGNPLRLKNIELHLAAPWSYHRAARFLKHCQLDALEGLKVNQEYFFAIDELPSDNKIKRLSIVEQMGLQAELQKIQPHEYVEALCKKLPALESLVFLDPHYEYGDIDEFDEVRDYLEKSRSSLISELNARPTLSRLAMSFPLATSLENEDMVAEFKEGFVKEVAEGVEGLLEFCIIGFHSRRYSASRAVAGGEVTLERREFDSLRDRNSFPFNIF